MKANNRSDTTLTKDLGDVASSRSGYQLSIFQLDDPMLSQIRDDILTIDINNLTPVEALNNSLRHQGHPHRQEREAANSREFPAQYYQENTLSEEITHFALHILRNEKSVVLLRHVNNSD